MLFREPSLSQLENNFAKLFLHNKNILKQCLRKALKIIIFKLWWFKQTTVGRTTEQINVKFHNKGL